MCKDVRLGERWVDLESALAEEGALLEAATLRLTHGLCPPCMERSLGDLSPPEGGW